EIFDWQEYAKCARKMVAESCVLLKKDDAVLPLKKGQKVSIFGRMQFDYLKSGTGSGGLVNAPYVVGILDGLRAKKDIILNEELIKTYEEWLLDNPFDMGAGWAQEPWFQKEMELSEEVLVKAQRESDIAIVIIGRQAGEDKDNSGNEGSYLLTQEERKMLEGVCSHFEKVVVLLNVGNIIDMKWVEEYQPQAVLYVWQGGQEGGNGVADILVGDETPSGKLTDTIAKNLEDYPSTKNFGDPKINIYEEDIYVGYRYFETFAKEKVLYPFGFGLSYTTFEIKLVSFQEKDEFVEILAEVKNTGNVSGKEILQVYVNPPQGKLGKPLRNLVAFAKTKELQPSEMEAISFTIDKNQAVSYDDGGYTGHPYAYVLEEGKYEYYLGNDVRSASLVGRVLLDELVVVEQLSSACAPIVEFKRMKPVGNTNVHVGYEKVSMRAKEYEPYEDDDMLDSCEYTGNQGYRLLDVYDKKVDLDQFIAQLSDKDLIYMSRGEGMCSPKVTAGTAGSFGGVTEGLQSFGIPIVCCSDGPSGIRMDSGDMAFSLPNGTAIGCSFNQDLCEELFEHLGKELNYNKIETLLGPGINIHRNPLNGRNFEYISEDPYVTGKMAVSQLHAMHRYNVTGTIKHFACNNQEFKRTESDSVVSERALREIYLKGFEMAVKEAGAYSIMTSYGSLNGVWTASNYDLLTKIAHEEWGFQGSIMTDWWAQMNKEGQEPSPQNTMYMVKAQNDLYMVAHDAESNSHGDNTEVGLEQKIITRAHLARNAKNICNFILKSPALGRMEGCYPLEIEERNRFDHKDKRCKELPDMLPTKEGIAIDTSVICTAKGHGVRFHIMESGNYTIDMVLNADIERMAQIPMTVYAGIEKVKMVTLSKHHCKNVSVLVDVEIGKDQYNYIKLFFGESGMRIDQFVIRKKEV
ncbi:MAG: glycoside hydrolase family 3 C-terminal domain-containing protein, partial [Eubacteriales bacterium]